MKNPSHSVLHVTLAVCALGMSNTADATSFGMFGTSPLQLHPEKWVSDGDEFTVSVGILIDDFAGLSQFSITVTWPDELIFVDAMANILIGGGGLMTDGIVALDDPFLTTTATWHGAGPGIFGMGEFIVGTITFQADNPITDGLPDALLGAGPLPWLDEFGLEVIPQFGDLKVNAVPGPGTLALLACSAAVAVRRRRRQNPRIA